METKSGDEINFQSYIVAVKEEKISWDFFVQLMDDLSNSEKRQKSLISSLLKELKYYLDMERSQFLRSSKFVENHEKVRENSTLDQDDAVTSMMAEVESVKLPNSVDDSKSLVNKLNEVDIGASKKTHDATNEEAISNSQQSKVG